MSETLNLTLDKYLTLIMGASAIYVVIYTVNAFSTVRVFTVRYILYVHLQYSKLCMCGYSTANSVSVFTVQLYN
jgi:hypothetical protein